MRLNNNARGRGKEGKGESKHEQLKGHDNGWLQPAISVIRRLKDYPSSLAHVVDKKFAARCDKEDDTASMKAWYLSVLLLKT